MLFSDLENTFKKYLYLADDGIIKLIAAEIVANQLPIPPPWLVVVASSSGGKSAILDALKNIPTIFAVDKLTKNTFLSGAKARDGKETSLLFQLPKNGILSIKDLTTIIAMNAETRGEIIGQLRKIYDRDFSSSYGTGETVSWKGKVGLIAGSTTKIYTVLHEFADLGERFVLYHMKMPDALTALDWATKDKEDGAIDDLESNKVMAETFAQFIRELKIPAKVPKFDEEARQELMPLANMATLARSAVERNKYSREKEQEFVHDREMPFRFMKVLMALGYGMQIINGTGKLEPSDKKILYRIALDSIPRNRKLVMNVLTEYQYCKASALQVPLNMERGLVERTLQDLNSLGIVDKLKDGQALVWKLKQEFRETISKFEGLEMTNQRLVEDQEVEALPEAAPEVVAWDSIIK